MKAVLVATSIAFLGALALAGSPAATPDARVYELRITTATPGKLDAVVAYFRDLCKLHEKHGITTVGYWTAEPDDGKLYSILAYASHEAAAKASKAVAADPKWKEVNKRIMANGGNLVATVKSTSLKLTDYSPPVKAPAGNHVYELRTYTARKHSEAALHARFRDHTMKLFEKHGMTNVGYWAPQESFEGGDTLVYLLAHKNMDAAKNSWAAFRADPDWVAVKKASEKDGWTLTVPDGVKSVYLRSTDYFPMK